MLPIKQYLRFELYAFCIQLFVNDENLLKCKHIFLTTVHRILDTVPLLAGRLEGRTLLLDARVLANETGTCRGTCHGTCRGMCHGTRGAGPAGTSPEGLATTASPTTSRRGSGNIHRRLTTISTTHRHPQGRNGPHIPLWKGPGILFYSIEETTTNKV